MSASREDFSISRVNKANEPPHETREGLKSAVKNKYLILLFLDEVSFFYSHKDVVPFVPLQVHRIWSFILLFKKTSSVILYECIFRFSSMSNGYKGWQFDSLGEICNGIIGLFYQKARSEKK